jgi:hypothetical protein
MNRYRTNYASVLVPVFVAVWMAEITAAILLMVMKGVGI